MMLRRPRANGCGSSERIPDHGKLSVDNVSAVGLAVRVVLCCLVTVTPWFFGGVQAAVQVWLFVGVAAALACWLLMQLTGRSASATLPVALVPLIFALVLGGFQLVPLGAEANAILSPGAARLRAALLPGKDSPDASLAENLGLAAEPERQPLSLYPASTRRDLSLLVLGTAVFLLGALFFKTSRARLWLCGLIAVNGALLAFFGLVQMLASNGLIYWRVPLTQGGGPFGPFVNRNNAAGFLLLCLAGAVGMTIWAVDRSRSSGLASGDTHSSGGRGIPAKLRQRFFELAAHIDGVTLTAVALAGCIIAGILCSLSRGAAVAMVGATIVSALFALCARGRTLRVWGAGIVAVVALFLVSWVGMRDSVYARLATLLDREMISQQARIPIWLDGLKAVADFWQVGSGLGTYRYVYSPYQERFAEGWYYFAENQYLEALVEGGILGLGLMLTMMALVGMAGWRLLRDDSDSRTFAFGIAGIFALTGQAIAGFFDFGLHIPANMLLFALMCGAMLGRAADPAKRGRPPSSLTLLSARPLPTLLATLLLGATIWGGLETRSAAATETTLKQVRFAETPSGVAPEALRDAIDQLETALEGRADDAEARQRLAELWIHLYRVRALKQLRDEATSAADATDLWEATSPVVLHGRSHYFAEYGLASELQKLRDERLIKDHLTRALRHLILARRCCPLLPDVHLRMAELCVLVVDPAGDAIHIQRSQQLMPSFPDVLFQCGVLELQAGRPDAAYDCWRRSLGLSSRYLGNLLGLAGRQVSLWHMVEKVLPDDPALLIQLARERYQDEEHALVRTMLIDRAELLVEQADMPEDERYYLRGAVLALKACYPEAIENYLRAVELRSREVTWRYELALALQHEGLLDEAHEQAKCCARMAPRHSTYRKLLEDIHEIRLRR